MQLPQPEKYKAAAYIRLSKEDGDKYESNSISNQRDLIRSFLKDKPDIILCSERIDDGYSGVSFNRPGLQELLEDIKAGEINCIVVKDLSRFGRNYIETGRYLEQIFPFLGVRFIAVNDNYDSADKKNRCDEILIPFKNLLNDAYSRDISIKIRSQIQIRQKHGDFMGSFFCYGYLRDETNRHKPIIDEFAAETVRKIFKMKAMGYSNKKISRDLNELGVPSPLEHKRLLNQLYFTGFKLQPLAKWSPTAIGRILENEIYTGTMVQGKETTASHKIKKRIKIPKNEWIRVENTHEPIISKEDFDLINKTTQADTRTSPGNNTLCPLSGLLLCPICRENMIRKPVKSQGKVYVYFTCSTNKTNSALCNNKNKIRESSLNECIHDVINSYIKLFSDRNELSHYENILPYKRETDNLQKLRDLKSRELSKYEKLISCLYEDYKTGVLNDNDYISLKENYKEICKEIGEALIKIESYFDSILRSVSYKCPREPENNLYQLTRPLLISLINSITVINKCRIRIEFSFKHEYG